jgi:hypothetical protein
MPKMPDLPGQRANDGGSMYQKYAPAPSQTASSGDAGALDQLLSTGDTGRLAAFASAMREMVTKAAQAAVPSHIAGVTVNPAGMLLSQHFVFARMLMGHFDAGWDERRMARQQIEPPPGLSE